MRTYLLFGLAILMSSSGAVAQGHITSTLAPSAQAEKPASPAKLALIRRFMKAIGLQDKLDTGSFLERYAVPGGPMWSISSEQTLNETLSGGFENRMTALRNAYVQHRAEFQKAYEDHLNWEFTEAGLLEIVGFLERPVGQHYLDGRWRMEAYVGTNTVDLEARIVAEAEAGLRK
jgi:hypothetical protein